MVWPDLTQVGMQQLFVIIPVNILQFTSGHEFDDTRFPVIDFCLTPQCNIVLHFDH